MDQLISPLISLDAGESFTFQSENLSGLCSFRYFDFHRFLQSGNFYTGSQCSICKIEVEFVYHLIAVSGQGFMWFFLDKNQKISGWSSIGSSISFTAERELHPLFHARRYVDFHSLHRKSTRLNSSHVA